MAKKNKILLFVIISLLYLLITEVMIFLFVNESFLAITHIGKNLIFVLFTIGFVITLFKKQTFTRAGKNDEQHLSTLINSMVDFVCFKDGEGRWLETNQFGLKLFQIEHVDYKGKTDTDLAEHTEFYREALIYCQEVSDRIAWENRTTTRCEEVIPMPNGLTKTFDTIKQPLFNEDGSRKALIVMGRDITERKLAEEKLLRSEKLSVIGELAASVAHEIRNPLTSLKGFVQFMKPDNRQNGMYYDIMLSELDRINHIVGELLLLAKPQEITFSKCDLSKTLKDVISLLEPQATMTNVQLEYTTSGPCLVECEVNQMKQLLINIIKNGIEASGEKGTVSINIKQKDHEKVLITVSDTGLGIPDEFLNRLGEPFYSSKERGTGLGLTVSFKIVQQHKGEIHFKKNEDCGTTVEIELPNVQ
ncbi:ATP-binding protein [Cytobacillus sp. FJAT-54145]|uniref:histidine kinase n=1 Tax=Cytobacillus spartinae TaxID=3299023 RepID=A0ABW6KF39_9BACI